MHTARIIFLGAALAAAAPAQALLIRADRDDAEYLELATRYSSVVWLGPVDAGGVLIAPRWILTDAGAAARLRDMKPDARLRLGGEDVKVDAVFIAPGRRAGLVLLATAAKGSHASALYKGRDELGKTVALAACGPTGRIGEATTRVDGRCRAAINTVDRVTDATLELTIKSPEDASDLQGASVDAEHGSPAYAETNGEILVVGIATRGKHAPGVGDSNVYVRVSALVSWIEETMLEVAKQEMNRLLDDSGRG